MRCYASPGGRCTFATAPQWYILLQLWLASAGTCHAARPTVRPNADSRYHRPLDGARSVSSSGCEHDSGPGCNGSSFSQSSDEISDMADGKTDDRDRQRLGPRALVVAAVAAAALLVGLFFLRGYRSRSSDATDGTDVGSKEPLVGVPGVEGLKELKELEKKEDGDLRAARQKLRTSVEEILKFKAQLPDCQGIRARAEEVIEAAGLAAEEEWSPALLGELLTANTEQVYRTLEERASSAQARAAHMALEEMRYFFTDLAAVFTAQKTMTEAFAFLKDELEIPSIVMLLCGALAPAQLRVLEVGMEVSLTKALIVLLITGAGLLSQWKYPCTSQQPSDEETPGLWRPSDELRFWLQVDFALGCLLLVMRLWVLRVVWSVGLTPRPDLSEASDPLDQLQLLSGYYMTLAAEAVVALDSIYRSWGYRLATWCLALNFFWMLYAWQVFSDIDEHRCSTWALHYLRLRVTLFLLFMLPELGLMIFLVMTEFADTEIFHTVALRAAEAADRALRLDFPAATILVQGVLFRRREDVTKWRLVLGRLRQVQLKAAVRAAERESEELGEEERKAKRQLHQLREEWHRERDQPKDEADQEWEKTINSAEKILKAVHRSSAAGSDAPRDGAAQEGS